MVLYHSNVKTALEQVLGHQNKRNQDVSAISVSNKADKTGTKPIAIKIANFLKHKTTQTSYLNQDWPIQANTKADSANTQPISIRTTIVLKEGGGQWGWPIVKCETQNPW